MYLIFIYKVTLRKNFKVKAYNYHKKLKQKKTLYYITKSKIAKSKHEVLINDLNWYYKSLSLCSCKIKIY